MRIITKRERIKGVLESWKKQYPLGKGRDEITNELSKLNLNKVSAKKINDIIGNNSWTRLRCDECEKDKEIIIMFLEKWEEDYESNSCSLCFDCLKKGLKELKEALKK